jgi:predicted  nucleic acid-binding Zn-ribbon protein
MTREQELEFLKTESQALRKELRELEDRIGQLSAERK